MAKPIVRAITDLSPAEVVARSIYRSQLSHCEPGAPVFSCKKPVWITCFFDGTGNSYYNDGQLSSELSEVRYSSIAKLAMLAHQPNDDTTRTYVLYAPGVGTAFPAIKDTGGGLEKATGMATAAKGELRISWMMDELTKRIDPHMPHINQINVAVFGFSRGAAQARAFVRRLKDICQQQNDDLIWTRSGGSPYYPRIVIYFMGLFDTVASVGFGGSRLEKDIEVVLGPVVSIPLRLIDGGGHAAWASDLRIPGYVRFCEHFVAAHEVREKFPSDSVRDDQVMPNNCRETFYPGAHSDVGGGYESMTQEGRTNELARIPLCNMYLSAYSAGVPFKPPKDVLSSAGSLFDISDELRECFSNYMEHISADERLESQCISHMNAYYHWRWGRTERRRERDKRTRELVLSGQSVVTATSDSYMSTTDREWDEDVVSIAEKRTGFFRWRTVPHEDAIFQAWKGTLRKALSPAKLAKFDMFFDRYVHDSIAGFKNQMSDAYVSAAEKSRWATNRRYFIGKRGGKFLYWQYEGVDPLTSPGKTALQDVENSSSSNSA